MKQLNFQGGTLKPLYLDITDNTHLNLKKAQLTNSVFTIKATPDRQEALGTISAQITYPPHKQGDFFIAIEPDARVNPILVE
jgi:hypothetical protein